MNIGSEFDSDSIEQYPRSCFSIARRHNRTRGKRGRPPKNKYISNIDYSSSVFPPQEHAYQDRTYDSVSTIKKLIEILNDTNPYAFVYQSETVLIFKCKRRKGCKSQITFQLDTDQNVYRIVKFVNTHNHSLKQTKQEEKEAFKYLEDNKILFVTKNQHQQLLNDKFGMNARRFLYLQWKYNKRCRMLYKELLQQQNCAFYCHFVDDNQDQFLSKNKQQRTQFPDILLYWTPKMNQLYHQYCDTLHFHHIPASFNFKSNQSTSRWVIGLISGLNKNASFIVLAVCIYDTSFDHPSLYENIFDIFLNQMAKKPQTIVTDYNQHTIKALQNMKNRQSGAFNFQFMINGVEFLKQCAESLKKNIKSQQQMEKAKIQILKVKSAILSRSQKQINQIVSPMYQEHDQQLLQLLQKNQSKIFANFLPKAFYGLTLFNVIDDDIAELVKKEVMKETSFIQIFHRINEINNKNHYQNPQSFLPSCKNRNCLKILNDINEQPNERFDSSQFKKLISEDQFYYQVFSVLSIKIFKIFHNQFEGSSKLLNKFIMQQDGRYKMSQQIQIQNNVCSCGYSRHTGIPCAHQLVVLRITGKRYLDFINHRWCIYGKQYQKHLNVIRKAQTAQERLKLQKELQKEKSSVRLEKRNKLQVFGLSKVSQTNNTTREAMRQERSFEQIRQTVTSNQQEIKSKPNQNVDKVQNSSQSVHRNEQKGEKYVEKSSLYGNSRHQDQVQKSSKSKQYQNFEQSFVVQNCPTCGQSVKSLDHKEQVQNEWKRNMFGPRYIPNPYYYQNYPYYYPESEANYKNERQKLQRKRGFQQAPKQFSHFYNQPYPPAQHQNPYYNSPMIPNPRFFQRQYVPYHEFDNYYKPVRQNARMTQINHQFQEQEVDQINSRKQASKRPFAQQNPYRTAQSNYQQRSNFQNNQELDRNKFTSEKPIFSKNGYKQHKNISEKASKFDELSQQISERNPVNVKNQKTDEPCQVQQFWED